MGKHAAFKPGVSQRFELAFDSALAKRNLVRPKFLKLQNTNLRMSYAFGFAMALLLVSVVDPYSGSIESASASTVYTPEPAGVTYDVYNYSSANFARGGFNILTGSKAAAFYVEDASVPSPGTAMAYALTYIKKFDWDQQQYSCLVKLWNRESNWRVLAENKQSGAYGIPQALPGRKMQTEGADWRTNPETQIRWGAKYIAGRYSTPCGALVHSNEIGWY